MNQQTQNSHKIGTDLKRAAELLDAGKVVAIPTETVYGLAANALDEKAVKEIFRIKGRPSTNPLIIHVGDFQQIWNYAEHVPTAAVLLLETFCPGPLTLVLPKKSNVPDIVTAGKNTVAIRVPKHPLTQMLLKILHYPLAAPSANPSGYISPTTAEHVYNNLGDKIDYILDGGACNTGIESTIVGFEGNTPIVYRAGTITIEQIADVTGQANLYSGNQHLAPGMSLSHYSPITPLLVTTDPDQLIALNVAKKIGLITYNQYSNCLPKEQQILLCKNEDFREAARNLYAALHDMDNRYFDLIIAKQFPPSAIGIALNDRLNRAAAPKP